MRTLQPLLSHSASRQVNYRYNYMGLFYIWHMWALTADCAIRIDHIAFVGPF